VSVVVVKYNSLGNSGVKVSQLCLGTMTFGSGLGPIGSVSQDEANEMVDYAIQHGINLFDTADIYSMGDSEKTLGSALKAAGVKRDSVIIATKVRRQMSNSVNDLGLSRHHILNAVENSLRRLKVDYIDLYQVHSWDPASPLEETMQALNDLVIMGKVRYIGVSNFAAWQVAKANNIAEKRGWTKFITYQGYYSLVGRGIENEIVPFCLDQRMGILAWSPLAGGLLSGKYRKGGSFPKGTRIEEGLKGFIPVAEEAFYRILDVIDTISHAHDVPVASVALTWLRYQKAVSSVIIGARNMAQLQENMKAGELELDREEIEKLNRVSSPELPYPQWMFEWNIRDRQSGNNADSDH
jgi:aryl-alcohol dehydrogenase-like predicted oxidoreductase